MAQSSPHVQFPESVKADERGKPKQQPTQKYDRKEIQKRLDIENWMEEQLADLYEVPESTISPVFFLVHTKIFPEILLDYRA